MIQVDQLRKVKFRFTATTSDPQGNNWLAELTNSSFKALKNVERHFSGHSVHTMGKHLNPMTLLGFFT